MIRSAGLVGGLTMASRVLGLLRDILLASFFFGWVLDAFVLAFTIPNLFRRLFGEGALASAFVPVLVQRLEAGDKEGASRLASTVLTALVVGLALVVGIGILISLGMIAAGAGAAKGILTWKLIAIMLPYLVLICAAALVMGVLNAAGHFGAPAAAPLLLNVAIIAAVLLAEPLVGPDPGRQVYALAVAVLVGGLLQLAVQIPLVRGKGIHLRPRWELSDPEVRKVGRALGPVVLGLAVFQLNVLADRLIAEWLIPHDGAVSVLFLSNRIIQLPLGVFAIALATVALPQLAALEARGERVEARRTLARAIENAIFIVGPAAVGIAILSAPQQTLPHAAARPGPLVEVLFAYGKFAAEAQALARAGNVVVLYAVGLVAFSAVTLLTRAFYARGDTRTPMKIGLVAVAVNLALNLALVGPLEESGLALASSLAAFVQMGLLAIYLWRTDPAGKKPALRAPPAIVGLACVLAVSVGGALLMQYTVLPRICDRIEPLFGVIRTTTIRQGDYEYTRRRDGTMALFDLDRDPRRRTNMAHRSDMQEIQRELEWMRQERDTNSILLDARIAHVGLVGGTQVGAGIFCVGLFWLIGVLAHDALARQIAERVWKIGLTILPMAILVHWFMWSMPPGGETIWILIQRVFFSVLIGVLAYWFFCGMVGLREYAALREALRRQHDRGAETAG